MKEKVNVLGKLVLVMLVFVMAGTQVAKADEIGDLKQQLARQQQMLMKMQQRLDQLEKRQKAAPVSRADKQQLESMVTKMFEENKSSFVAPDWVHNIKPYGDFRFRYEELTNGTGVGDNLVNKRRRNRIRARLGFKAKINDEWDTNFRIASGSSETPTSTNQTLGEAGTSSGNDQDAFASKSIWLDLAYADWHPDSLPGLNVYMGKMKNPFYRVGKNQLVWDSDVNPEGIAATYKFDVNRSTAATITGAGFWMEERSGDGDAGYFGVQTMLKHKFDDDRHLIGGATYYNLSNIEDNPRLGSVNYMGNTAYSGVYKYDFDIVEGFGEYGWKCNGIPVAVFGNYLENIAAPAGRNQAFSIGGQFNKAKKPGSWQLHGYYREVESDAVFGGLSDSDFIDGGTGGKGWVLGYKYQLAKNLQAGLTYFINDRDRRAGGNDEWSGGTGAQTFERIQADLIFKF